MVLVAVVALAACKSEAQHPEDLDEVLRSHRSGGQAVLRVGDRTVGSTAYEAFWEAHPELERDASVEEFVAQELAFEPALAAGHASDAEVALARKRRMVRQLLAETVEQKVTEESLSDDKIEKRAERIAAQLGHPPGIRASHILIKVPKAKKSKSKGTKASGTPAEKVEQAKSWIEKVRAELPPNPTPFQLLRARRDFESQLPESLSVEVNVHLHFPSVAVGSELPETWMNVVADFRNAAVRLASEERFGQLSEPVQSEFGWHLIVVHEVLDGAKPDPSVARAVAVEQLLEEKRFEEFKTRYQQWEKGVDVRSFPNVIDEADQLQN